MGKRRGRWSWRGRGYCEFLLGLGGFIGGKCGGRWGLGITGGMTWDRGISTIDCRSIELEGLSTDNG